MKRQDFLDDLELWSNINTTHRKYFMVKRWITWINCMIHRCPRYWFYYLIQYLSDFDKIFFNDPSSSIVSRNLNSALRYNASGPWRKDTHCGWRSVKWFAEWITRIVLVRAPIIIVIRRNDNIHRFYSRTLQTHDWYACAHPVHLPLVQDRARTR